MVVEACMSKEVLKVFMSFVGRNGAYRGENRVLADNGGPLSVKTGMVLIVIGNNRYDGIGIGFGFTGSLVGSSMLKAGNGVIMPNVPFDFDDGAAIISTTYKGRGENRGGKLIILKSRANTFEPNELGSDNTLEGVGRMKRGTVEKLMGIG